MASYTNDGGDGTDILPTEELPEDVEFRELKETIVNEKSHALLKVKAEIGILRNGYHTSRKRLGIARHLFHIENLLEVAANMCLDFHYDDDPDANSRAGK